MDWPERELALWLILDAVSHLNYDFLTGSGEYSEITAFWFSVAGLEVFSDSEVKKIFASDDRARLSR